MTDAVVRGRHYEPCAPSIPRGPWPDGATALKRLGTDLRTLRMEYDRRADQLGALAALDSDVVAEILPPQLWPVVQVAAIDGPAVFAERAERAVKDFARELVPADKRRAAGPPALNSVRGLAVTYRRLAGSFVLLRDRGLGFPELDEWDRAPAIRVPDVTMGPTREVRAPRPEAVRLTWHRLDRELRERLAVDAQADLVEAVRGVSRSQLFVGGLFQAMRAQVTLSLFVLLGGRADAIRRLDRSDYLKDRIGPPPDRRRSAVLLLRPGKTVAEDLVRRKPIPEGLETLMDAWLLLLSRLREALYSAPPSMAPRRPATPTMPPDHPLLVSSTKTLGRWDGSSLKGMFSGQPPSGGNCGQRALIPRDTGWRDDLPFEHRDYVGYTPHEFRRLAEQLAEEAGARWNRDHPSAGARLNPDPALYGSALLDHKAAGDAQRNLYADRNQESVYEILSGRASEYIWRLITTDAGIRRRPSRSAIEDTAERLRMVEADLASLHRRAERLGGDAHEELPPKLVFTPLRASSSEHELLTAIACDQRRFSERQDILLGAVADLRRAVRDSTCLLYEQSALSDLRDELREHARRLWSDEQYWEVVPDTEPAGAEHVDFTLEAIMRSPGGCASAQALPGEWVRDWILPIELAWVRGVDRATIIRQLAGSHLPRRPEDRPWEADAVPVDESLGLRFRRIWVPGIPKTYWRTAEMRRRLQLVLSEWPNVQGWRRGSEPTGRALAPLVLPEPFGDRRVKQLPRTVAASSERAGA